MQEPAKKIVSDDGEFHVEDDEINLSPVTAEGWISLGSEGGHTSFSPRDEREIAILRHAWKQYDHVSFERLLSGPGLELMYKALAEYAKQKADDLSAPEITQRALDGTDPVCVDTLEVFCALLGTAAANLAVTLGALGGIYIGGSIVPRLGPYFDRSPFRSRFEDKGRFSRYVADIPTFVITAEHATFTGASAILEAQLRTISSAPRAHSDGRPGTSCWRAVERLVARGAGGKATARACLRAR